jgi:DNA-binding FadR family transcriptional regulator
MFKETTGNLTRQVVVSMGRSIILGNYPVDHALPPEATLCAGYGASRTILREAIKMLTAKGLLNARPRRGTVVEPERKWNLNDPDVLSWLLHREYSIDLIQEFTEMRLALEPVAAGLAAERITTEHSRNIELAIKRMRAAEIGKDDPLESDIAFHVGILEATANRFFINMQYMIEVALRSSIRMTNQMKGVKMASVDDHQHIFDCIRAKDAQGAETAMRALILEAKALLKKARRMKQTK